MSRVGVGVQGSRACSETEIAMCLPESFLRQTLQEGGHTSPNPSPPPTPSLQTRIVQPQRTKRERQRGTLRNGCSSNRSLNHSIAEASISGILWPCSRGIVCSAVVYVCKFMEAPGHGFLGTTKISQSIPVNPWQYEPAGR